jgi:hypothetical protein
MRIKHAHEKTIFKKEKSTTYESPMSEKDFKYFSNDIRSMNFCC